MSVCVYVCVDACMRVCVSVCVRACACVCVWYSVHIQYILDYSSVCVFFLLLLDSKCS